MALKKYIGPYDEGEDVYLNGDYYGTVKPGDILSVPDAVAGKYAWAEGVWADVTSQKDIAAAKK
jgi:hypothetical protein